MVSAKVGLEPISTGLVRFDSRRIIVLESIYIRVCAPVTRVCAST